MMKPKLTDCKWIKQTGKKRDQENAQDTDIDADSHSLRHSVTP